MHQEFRAITTRVARSFVRVGGFETTRGAGGGPAIRSRDNSSRNCFGTCEQGGRGSRAPATPRRRRSCRPYHRRAPPVHLLALSWQRVGYVNQISTATTASSEALTTRLRAFGFMERYDPKWAMWVGWRALQLRDNSRAARRNWETLVSSLEPPSTTRPPRPPRAGFCRRSEQGGGEDVGRQTWALLDQRQRSSSPLERLDRHHVFVRDRRRVKLWADLSSSSTRASTTTFWRLLAAAKRSGAHALRRSHRHSMSHRRRRRRSSGGLARALAPRGPRAWSQ